ncbi:hypothetical protein D3C79_1053970 [compost metagenome]
MVYGKLNDKVICSNEIGLNMLMQFLKEQNEPLGSGIVQPQKLTLLKSVMVRNLTIP